MKKTLIVLFLVLMVCGLVSSAYAEKRLLGETLTKSVGVSGKPEKSLSGTLMNSVGKVGKTKDELKLTAPVVAPGRAVRIIDSQGKPVSITDENGKTLNIIVGSKGNLVVQKPMAIEKAGVKNSSIKQDIIKFEKPTIARPAKPQKPEFTKPQPITNFK